MLFLGPRAALLAGGLLLATAASAQVISPDAGGESCKVTPQCEEHRYEFGPGPGQQFGYWTVAGDEKLLTPADQNPAVACSEGYGKGRLTAHYYELRKDERCGKQCPDTVWRALAYDLFKSFKAPAPVRGPVCVQAGQAVTWSVPPLLTDWPHRGALIGTDSYFWSGFPAGSVLHFSGDSASVTAELPAGLPAGFTVRVQVGRCNDWAAEALNVRVGQALAAAVAPICGGSSAGLTIATLPGVNYAVSLPVGWSFAGGSTGTVSGNGQPQDVFFTITGAGNVVVTATGGCGGAQTTALVFTVTP